MGFYHQRASAANQTKPPQQPHKGSAFGILPWSEKIPVGSKLTLTLPPPLSHEELAGAVCPCHWCHCPSSAPGSPWLGITQLKAKPCGCAGARAILLFISCSGARPCFP